MSVEQTNKIDFSTIDKLSGDFSLSISDHLAWEEDEINEHLLLLQEEINSYLSFIESG